MSAINCPICGIYTQMFAQCENCGIKMCSACFCKGASSKCPSCGALSKVKKI